MQISDLCAADLMHAGVTTIPASADLREAIDTMRAHGIRALFVPPTKAGEGYGILTTKDVVALLDNDELDLLGSWKVAELMTRPVVSVPPTMGILDCIRLMRMTGVRRIPVLEGNQLAGVLSYTDIFNWMASNTQSCASS